MSQADVMYAAMRARDYRFDGKFFVAVKTTGVYCRPICPVRPKRENVEFFRLASEAEKAGYRPCLRCRPESAPASPAWIGKSAVVQRALRHIAAGALLEADENEFADKFGMSARHLRRLFVDEIGQTPKQIADVQRLDFARTLVVETALPMTSIALNSSFASLRRFNEAFRNRFRRSPSEIRKRSSKTSAEEGITLTLAYRPPFDWAYLLDFFARHPITDVERIDGDMFERVFRLGKTTGVFQIKPVSKQAKLFLRVFTTDVGILYPLVRKVRAMFDLDSDPLLIANTFDAHPVLARALKRFPGLRIPGSFDGFEASVNAILGQVVSVSHAARLRKMLVKTFGEEGKHPLSGETISFFPSPKKLAAADLSSLGITRNKKSALHEFAERVASGRISLAEFQDPESFRKSLTDVRGIGNWTAEYISLRVLGDTDVFPSGDLVLRKSLARHSDLDLQHVRPWRSYAALHLWKSELLEQEN